MPPALRSIFIKTLPWIVALGYLLLVASLGWSFHKIEAFKIDSVAEVSTDGQSSPVELGLFRISKEHSKTSLFQLTFESTADTPRLAVFLPRLSSDARISVNGTLLQLDKVSYRARHQYQPQLIAIPEQVLNTGQPNLLNIELHAHGPAMLLSKFYLGPQVNLEPTYRYFYFFRTGLVHSALAITLLLAIFMATFWLVRPQFNEYGWLALAFLAFNYYLLSFAQTSEAVHFQLYSWSYLLARGVFVWAFVLFVHRFLQLHRRRFEYFIGGFFALVFGIGLILVLRDQYVAFLQLTFFTSLPMVLLIIAYVCVVLSYALIKSGHVYLHWLLVGSLFGLLLGAHDALVLFDWQHWLIRDFYISHYSILFIAAGYGGVLVHRVARALFNSEDLNVELNRLLDIKTSELEQAASARLQQEKQLTLYAERQRILADMHDGVGGQLVGLLAASRDGRLNQQTVTEELDLILADLRLVLDALTPAGEELVMALARLRERYTALLGHADIQLHWRIDPGIDAINMPPSLTINILRLIQEAIQNSIKHAQADNITLQLTGTAELYTLTIADDGIGINNATPGHGTKTMQQRAMAVNGNLEISTAAEGGTRITLGFPAPGNKAAGDTH